MGVEQQGQGCEAKEGHRGKKRTAWHRHEGRGESSGQTGKDKCPQNRPQIDLRTDREVCPPKGQNAKYGQLCTNSGMPQRAAPGKRQKEERERRES